MLTEQQCANGNRHTLSIVRGKTGFGFTVTGARPTCVGRVAPGTHTCSHEKIHHLCRFRDVRVVSLVYKNIHLLPACALNHGTAAGKTRQIQCEL